jgi:hypothetical protein
MTSQQENEVRKHWNNLQKLPWAWEGHYAAKVAWNGKLAKDAHPPPTPK